MGQNCSFNPHQLLQKLMFVLGECNKIKLDEVFINILRISYFNLNIFYIFYNGIVFCLLCRYLFCYVIVLIAIFWLNEILIFFGIYHFYYRIIGHILVIFSCLFVDCFKLFVLYFVGICFVVSFL